jgi:hypothetical protein
MARDTGTPEASTPGALQDAGTGFAGSADAVSVAYYTTSDPPRIPPRPCHRLVTWLHCRECLRDSFAAGAPSPQPCPAWAGGRLQPITLWDVRRDAALPEMLLGGEVSHAHLG